MFCNMFEISSNVRFTWQLVSQFISWDFCKYSCQQYETGNTDPDIDVLTFLRNMIVERTEKSVSDVTKHEIVAKLIMESKAVRTISRLPCVQELSEAVKKICPELEAAVNKLVQQLETLLNILDWNDANQNHQLILMKIDAAVNEFSKEACTTLPVPDLLKVVQPWLNFRFPDQRPQEKARKAVYNNEIFEKTLECLHKEKITPSESKAIAVALYEDKTLENILLHPDSDSETLGDSEMFSMSLQFTEPGYSEDFPRSMEDRIHKELFLNSLDLNSQQPVLPSTVEREVRSSLSAERTSIPEHQNELNSDLRTSLNSTPEYQNEFNNNVMASTNGSSLTNRSSSLTTANKEHVTPMQFAISSNKSSSDSDSLDLSFNSRINAKKKLISSKLRTSNKEKPLSSSSISDGSDFEITARKKTLPARPDSVSPVLHQISNNESDSDTSDCDKNPQCRFLTPTMFRSGYSESSYRKKIIWLSDSESNGSDINTPVNSQTRDPTWKTDSHISTSPRRTKRRKLSKSSKRYKEKKIKQNNVDNFIPDVTTVSKQNPRKEGPSKKRTARKKPTKNDGISKKQVSQSMRCRYCDKVYKIELNMRKHLFMVHDIALEIEDLGSAVDFI